MAADNSLNSSMTRAVKRSASLFKVPSYQKGLYIIAGLCVAAGLLASFTLFSMSYGILYGLALGSSLFSIVFFLDLFVSKLVLAKDPILDLKRTAGLSIFGWASWLFFIIIGVGTATFGLLWWMRLCLLGYSAVLIMRLIVLSALSVRNSLRYVFASFLQPFVCMISFLVLWTIGGQAISFPLVLFLIFSPVIALGSSGVFMFALNRVGQKMLGKKSMVIFRAFLLSWVLNLNGPFEAFLEELSEEKDIEVSIIKLTSSKMNVVGAVPAVHPGPFKNIGSSVLPSQLKAAIEAKTGCEAFVPHGLMGHEYDLPSQAENQKVINGVIDALNFDGSEAAASPFVTVSNDLATACCQIFGKSALISFTLAPRTIEDLPIEIGKFVRQKAEMHGLATCIVVNSHNSIDGTADPSNMLESLKKVGAECLEETAHLKQMPAEMGAASFLPKEWGVKDGMGTGGITALAIKVGQQKSVYVTIDGNNMVSGLREKIITCLHSAGFQQAEIFTSDTHSVSGLITGSKRYHPVGEAMDQELLSYYVAEVSKKAASFLEPARISCRSTVIPRVRVIGEERLDSLLLLIEKGVQRAKRAIVPILLATGFLLMLFLLLL
jgi:predicted neutral ceramidase superfamily lipid hydrolase